MFVAEHMHASLQKQGAFVHATDVINADHNRTIKNAASHDSQMLEKHDMVN